MDAYEIMMLRKSIEDKNNHKLEDLMLQLGELENISTLEGAKELITKLGLNDKKVIFFGSAKCTIYNEEDCLSITIDSPTEFVNYSF